MRFGGDNRIWFIFSPHVEGEMREILKKTILKCIIEDMIGRTIEGGISKCHKVGVKVMAHYGRAR